MSHIPDNPEFSDEYPVHKSRPSLTTNASGIAESTMSYASMTTVEGLKRLSQFPPPPTGVPLTPFEASLGFDLPPSPTSLRDGMMTPPATPPQGPVRPSVVTAAFSPPSKVFSLPPRQETSPRRKTSVLSGSSMDSSSTSRTSRPLPTPGVYSPLSVSSPLRTPYISPTASSKTPLSPHDWHDGSSSIAVDPYEERLLSTSFITNLLTHPENVSESQQPPPTYKHDYYEPSVASDIMSGESSVTYPPRRIFPDPDVGPSTKIPIASNSRAVPSTVIPTAGRDTPASMHTSESTAGGLEARSLSLTQSLSTTPLNQSFPRSEPINEEQGGEYSRASSSTPAPSSRKRERRQSAYSSRTTKSYVSSLITRMSHSTNGDRKSYKQTAHWFRKKPLPPVPRLPNISMVQEAEYRQAEAALPLPELMNRAQTLSQMLDKGHRPYSHNQLTPHPGGRVSLASDEGHSIEYGDDRAKQSGFAPRSIFRVSPNRRNRPEEETKGGEWEAQAFSSSNAPLSKPFGLFKQHKLCVGITLLVIIVVVVVVAVSVTLTRKHRSQPKCSGNLTGATCSLDATCVCTGSSGQCGNQLAQNLVDLVPTMNTLFSTSFTTASLAQAIWLAQGDPGNSCANQARLVDVAPGLDVATSPNRTQWGQAALLWDLVESNNLPDVSTLQKFVVSAPWSKLGSPDGATPDTSSKFTTTVSGWEFNFAAQTVTAPPQTFVNIGQPSSAQIAKVDDTARAALDRMYTFALASATQHQKALSTYWTAVLQQSAANLNQFLSRVRGSQILLPFDATLSSGNQPLSALLTNSSSAPFPPPLACYPGLSVTQVQAISTFETTVFNLSSVSNATKFDTSCFPDRPIYGVLDIAGLRLPFVDSRTGVAKQAAVLTTPSTEAVTRVVVYSGEVLGALPGSSNLPVLNSTVMDPRRFGTMNHLEHVILQYLQSIPDVNVAIALVEYVMAGSAAPPTSDNILFSGLATLPAIEVAVFGTIDPSDVDSSLSSLSDPGGKLFFGSDQSLAVRQWTIDAVQSHVEWTALATSSDAVEDSSFSDINFNEVWNPAFAFFHTTNQAIVGVSNITQGFCTEGKLPNC